MSGTSPDGVRSYGDPDVRSLGSEIKEASRSLAVSKLQNTEPRTTEMLYRVFRTHVTLKHSEEMNQSAARIVREATKEE